MGNFFGGLIILGVVVGLCIVFPPLILVALFFIGAAMLD